MNFQDKLKNMTNKQNFVECSVLGCQEAVKMVVLLHGTNFGTPVCTKHFCYYVENHLVAGGTKWEKDLTDICEECGERTDGSLGLCQNCENLIIEENYLPEEEIPSISETLGQVEAAYR